MDWQNLVVGVIVAAALFFLLWKIWPKRRRPDVKPRDLVKKNRKKR